MTREPIFQVRRSDPTGLTATGQEQRSRDLATMIDARREALVTR